jgi:hypothetical protein
MSVPFPSAHRLPLDANRWCRPRADAGVESRDVPHRTGGSVRPASYGPLHRTVRQDHNRKVCPPTTRFHRATKWFSSYAYAGPLAHHTTGRGIEQLSHAFPLIDVLPYGRQEQWQDVPQGWPQGETYAGWPDSPDIARWYGQG